MIEKRFVYYEHKGADYILDIPNIELDFIEMLGDALEPEEIVDKLNELYEENRMLKKSVRRQEKSNDECSKYIEEVTKENKALKQLLNSINGSFTFNDNYVSWFEDCVIVSKEGLKEINLGSDFE